MLQRDPSGTVFVDPHVKCYCFRFAKDGASKVLQTGAAAAAAAAEDTGEGCVRIKV